MIYLGLFILGIAFEKWVVPFLDILLEWYQNIVTCKVHAIQSDIAVANKELQDYCKDDDKGTTHAIGFRMDESEEFIDLDEDEDED